MNSEPSNGYTTQRIARITKEKFELGESSRPDIIFTEQAPDSLTRKDSSDDWTPKFRSLLKNHYEAVGERILLPSGWHRQPG